MEHNNLYDWHLCFSPYLPVLQSQKLEIEQLFLRFCSIRTNKYELNQSATYISYCVPSLSHFLRETWKQGRRVTEQESAQRFRIILSGRLKMGQTNPDTGRMVTLSLLQPGDGFDVISLLDGQPNPVILEAQDDLLMLSTPMQEARRWIEEHPIFNRSFLPYRGVCRT